MAIVLFIWMVIVFIVSFINADAGDKDYHLFDRD